MSCMSDTSHIKLLLKAKANTSIKNKNGLTALDIADSLNLNSAVNLLDPPWWSSFFAQPQFPPEENSSDKEPKHVPRAS